MKYTKHLLDTRRRLKKCNIHTFNTFTCIRHTAHPAKTRSYSIIALTVTHRLFRSIQTTDRRQAIRHGLPSDILSMPTHTM